MWSWIETLFHSRGYYTMRARLNEVERERAELLSACQQYLDSHNWPPTGQPYADLTQKIRAAVADAIAGEPRRRARDRG